MILKKFNTGQNHKFSVQNSPIKETLTTTNPMCKFVVQMCFCSFSLWGGLEWVG
jgi:hypothetical protein